MTYPYSLLLVVPLLLSACAFTGTANRHGVPVALISAPTAAAEKSSPPALATSAVEGTSGAAPVTVDAAPAAVASAAENPYLSHRGAVPSAAQKAFDRAVQTLASGDQEGALSQFKQLVERYPHLSGPRLNLALILEQKGEADQAQLWFRRAIDANKNNINAYNQLAIFLRRQGRFADAEKVYLDGLAVWQESPLLHRNIGVLYDLYLGDGTKALRHYRQYQLSTQTAGRSVAGWIADLERRQQALAGGDES